MSKLSDEDFLKTIGRCADCHAHVSEYKCGSDLGFIIPDSTYFDTWVACDNDECENHGGEGVCNDEIFWVLQK